MQVVARPWRIVAMLAAVLLHAPLASAQSSSQCQELFREAEALREQCFSSPTGAGAAPGESEATRWRCVVDALEARRRREDAPALRYMHGLASMQIEQWVRAWNLLTEAIASGDPCVNNPEQNREDLAEVRPHIGLLEPESNVRGARLQVDGVDVGELPLTHPFAVNAGAVRVRITASGYNPYEHSVTADPSEPWRGHVTLVLSSTPIAAPRRSALRPAGWVLIGSGAALGVAGAVFWALSWDTANEFERYCSFPQGAALRECMAARDTTGQANLARGSFSRGALCTQSQGDGRLSSLCARGDAFPVAAVALGVGGAIALASGVTALLAAPSRRAPTTSAAVWVQPSAGGVVFQQLF